jgi:hypothetical protein
MYKILLFLFTVVLSLQSRAQTKSSIPLLRKSFHENIDKSQKAIDKLDKKEDRSFNVTSDTEVNQQVSYTLFNKIDQIQDNIEADSTLDSNQKIKFLRSLNEALAAFESGFRSRELKAEQLPDLINAYQDAMALEKKGSSIKAVLVDNDFEIGDILVRCVAFQKNPGLVEGRESILLKSSQKHPERIIKFLAGNPNASFSDSLLRVVAYTHQEDIYTYAQSNTALGRKIQKSEDPLIKTIASLASLKEGRLYFTFLDNL